MANYMEAKAAAPPSSVANLILHRGGNVSDVDFNILERILPHCTVDQLWNIEKSTRGRDLSPITDKLWEKICEAKFGADPRIEKIKRANVVFRWVDVYEAKLEADRLKNQGHQIFEAARIQIPSSSSNNERSSSGSGINNVSSRKGSVPMKKLRSEVRNCLEVRNRKIMKNYSSAKDKSTFKPSDIIVLDD